MNEQAVKAYLLAKPHALLDFPFGVEVAVFKVKSKMFALLGQRNGQLFLNLKCDPDEGAALRDIYAAILPGYHMDKRHWISVLLDGSVPEGEIKRLMDVSFDLVVDKLPKKEQMSIRIQL